MNVLTTGIILFSFYTCLCMDSDDDVFGADDGSMLPPHQRSSMFSEPLGSLHTGGYGDEEFENKFKHMRIGKKPKDKLGRTNQPQPGAPGAYPPPAAAGGFGGYPSQSGQGVYPPQGYVGQPGAPGAYGGGYPSQQGATGGFGGYPSQSGQGVYPPQGPYAPPGAAGGYGGGAGGYGGGASGPGQPTGPPGHTPGVNLLTIDAKTKHNGANIIVDEYRAGRPERIHRQFDPVPGCGINQVNYNGKPVWKMIGEKYAVKVVLFPIGFEEKTIVITMIGGENEIYKKKGRNKPWTKQ
uniref:CD8+ T-cell target antigen Tp9 n=1 Tax=Theileria parva lawrencei TaxID=1148490 RepID=H9A5L1_THEPA|nr:CD8+ T-cell target antigen Tp9 [Theileria parva lawrencei]